MGHWEGERQLDVFGPFNGSASHDANANVFDVETDGR